MPNPEIVSNPPPEVKNFPRKVKSLSTPFRLTDIDGVAAYLQRIGAGPRGLLSAVITEREGKYRRDLVVIRFDRDGKVTLPASAPEELEPTKEEREDLTAGFSLAVIPEGCSIPELPEDPRVIGYPPEEVRLAKAEGRLFVFRDRSGEILMLQERIDHPETGDKIYLPWSYWNDNRWRRCEPEGEGLPLYGLEELQTYGVVWVHEGAKAARRCQEIRDSPELLAAHPWGKDLENVAHLGWASGAPNPDRNDWSALQGFQTVVIIGDNDAIGKRAVPRISRRLSCPAYLVQFPERFPPGFDLGDPFPKTLFQERPEGGSHYDGPPVGDCLHPATWATSQIEKEGKKKGRPSYRLRDAFADQWVWIAQLGMFGHRQGLVSMLDAATWNAKNRRFSDVARLEDLFHRSRVDEVEGVDYLPGVPERLVQGPGQKLAYNLYVDSGATAAPDICAEPWLEFVAYLVPNERERGEVLRWIATLLARPKTRMGYSLLMVSERQGVGKSLLGTILADCVGRNNASSPGISDIMSDFNAWSANRRLAVVHECYGENPRAVYNRLKSLTTDLTTSVNQKFIPQYEVRNCCHVYACSNHLGAIRFEDDDRRWFYPTLTEEPWPREKFEAIWQWIRAGGLGSIRAWADRFGKVGRYVGPGEHAPATDRKKEAIEASQPEYVRLARQLAVLLMERKEPAVLLGRDVRLWLTEKGPERISMQAVKRSMLRESAGELWTYPSRIRMNGYPERLVIYNRPAAEALREAGEIQGLKFLGESTIAPSGLDQDRI